MSICICALASLLMLPASAQTNTQWQSVPGYTGWVTYTEHDNSNDGKTKSTYGAGMQVQFTVHYNAAVLAPYTRKWTVTYYSGTAKYRATERSRILGISGPDAQCENFSQSLRGASTHAQFLMHVSPTGYVLIMPGSDVTLKGTSHSPPNPPCGGAGGTHKASASGQLVRYGSASGPLPTNGNVLCGSNVYRGSVLKWWAQPIGVPAKTGSCPAKHSRLVSY
ncbi:MAG: hypothetical protein ACYDBU_11230 [Vulcanimicrobiaceae bacterium]